MKYLICALVVFLSGCNQEKPQAMVVKQSKKSVHNHTTVIVRPPVARDRSVTTVLPEASASVSLAPRHEHHHQSLSAVPNVAIVPTQPQHHPHEHGHG